MNDVSQILNAIEQNPRASEQLLPLVYKELRKLAAQKLKQEKPGQTLEATALVHEAYIRLVGGKDPPSWNGRAHFFGAAAEAMRRILIENARRKLQLKHGGDLKRVTRNPDQLPAKSSPEDLLAIDEALECMARVDAQAAELVKLRFFGGLTMEQAADLAGLKRTKAYEHWYYARACLYRCLKQADREVQP